MKRKLRRVFAWICTIAVLFSSVAITPRNSIEAETTADGWVDATTTWTTDGVWNIWTGNGGVSKYQNNDTLNDYYVNIVTGGGQWSVQTNTIVTGLTASTLYTYRITMESDKEGTYVGSKEEFSNSTLVYKTLTANTSTVFEGTFTSTGTEAKLFLEMGNAANSGATIHITNVEVVPYEASEEQSGNIVEGKTWQGWFEAEGWASYGIGTDYSGYTLENKNIGANWYSIQTGIDNVQFVAGNTYTCSFILTAPNPKEFTVDNRVGDGVVFVENAGGEWVDNGDGTYSYNYVGKYTPTATGFINIRVALGYHNNKDGKTDANYAASSTATFTLSNFSIVVGEAEETTTEEVTTEEVSTEPFDPSTITEWTAVSNSTELFYYIADGRDDAVNVKPQVQGTDDVYTAFTIAGPLSSVKFDGSEITTFAGSGVTLKVSQLTAGYHTLSVIDYYGNDSVTVYFKSAAAEESSTVEETTVEETTVEETTVEESSSEESPSVEETTVSGEEFDPSTITDWTLATNSANIYYYVADGRGDAVSVKPQVQGTDDVYTAFAIAGPLSSVKFNGSEITTFEGSGVTIKVSQLTEGYHTLTVIDYYQTDTVTIYFKVTEAAETTTAAPTSAPTINFVNGEEILNRTDFGDGCLEESEATYNDDNGLWIEVSASGALYTNNGDGSVDIVVPAYAGTENNFDTQLKQHAVHLKQGKSYRIRYAVSSDVDKTVQFLLQDYTKNWTVYSSQNTIVKAGTTEYVEFVYTHNAEDTVTALFGLMMGPINGPCTAANVTISDVSLIGYDTEAEATNHPKRVIEIISSATSDGKISLYWNVAGGNTNAPAGQVYDVEVDGEMLLTNLQYTSTELTEMATGEHTITIYSKLDDETSVGYTVKVVVPEASKTAFGIVVDQVTTHDKDILIGSGWIYNFPLKGSDNFVGVDGRNDLVIYSPTANENSEYVYRTLTDLTVGKYYTYTFTITSENGEATIPVYVTSEGSSDGSYDITTTTSGYTYKCDFCATDDTMIFRYDVKSLSDVAIKISAVTATEINPIAVVGLAAASDIDDIVLNWNTGIDASVYQTYTISYVKDGTTTVQVVTDVPSSQVSYTISNVSEGKYIVTVTAIINGKEASSSTQTISVGAAIISADLSVEGFQIKTNGTLENVAYRAICKSPKVGSLLTDSDGNVYTVKEFGTIYVLDVNWSGFLKNNKVSSVYTMLDISSRNGQRYNGAYAYEGKNLTVSYVATSIGVIPEYNNDDDANSYYVQTMTGMDGQMAFGIHVRAFAIAIDANGNEVIVYGDEVASTSVGQIADYFYNNSMATNYVAHEYLFNSILNSKYLTVEGILEANPTAEAGTENNRYYRTVQMEYGWNGNLYGPSVIPIAAPWKYHMSTSYDMISSWNTLEFDDSTWSTAIAPFGDRDVGNIMYNTLWGDEYTYLWMRKSFTIKDATDYANHSIVLTTWYDENPKIYLNGHLIFEDTASNPYKFTEGEADDRNWVDEYTTINLGTEYSQYLVDGTNVVSIECQNTGGGRMMDCGVTLVK